MRLISSCSLSVFASLMLLAIPAALAQAPTKQKATGNAADREQFRKETAAKAEAPLSPELLAIAERVQTGRIPCELGHNVAILPDTASAGYFTITTGSARFRAIPVATTTGAIRLEDKARGGVWLQLANKSMLLDEKNGKRLADECMSPGQKQVADAMRAAPPSSIIGSPVGTVPNAAPLPQTEAPAPAPAPLNVTPQTR
jgi:hypothetical protein